MNQIIRLKHIVIAFYIVLMAVQIIALEGFGVSPIKVIAMLFAPALMFIWKYTNTVSIIFVYAGVYILLMIVCCAIGGSLVGLNMSWERIGYRTMYLMMFLLIYSIIYEDIIDIRFIRNVLKFLLLAYGLTFIFQHLFFVISRC